LDNTNEILEYFKPNNDMEVDVSRLTPNNVTHEIWISRHSERIDFVYSNSWWMREDLLGEGIYPNQYNRFDPCLTQRGKWMASVTGAKLQRQKFRHIFSSPAYRCIQTANEIAKHLGLRIKIEQGLFEWINYERPEQWCTPEYLVNRENKLIDTSYKSYITISYSQRESTEDWVTRTTKLVEYLYKVYNGNFLFVAHAGSHQVLAKALKLVDFSALAIEVDYVALSCFTKLNTESPYFLRIAGDRSHIHDIPPLEYFYKFKEPKH